MVSALYPSSSELKHACSVGEALSIVRQYLDGRAEIEGVDVLRHGLMLPFDSEVLKQVESGEWLLIMDEAYCFDAGEIHNSVGAKMFDHRVKELMNPPRNEKKRYGFIFRVINFETRESLIGRPYIAKVGGEIIEGQTDGEGLVHVLAPSDSVPISIRVAFRTPLQHAGGFFAKSSDATLVTELMAHELNANAWICRIAVNDRAMTREFILNAMDVAGFKVQARSSWGAKSAKDWMAQDWNYSKIALHHAGRSYGCGDFGAMEMRKAQNEHLGRGYDDIGYHFGIDCAGQIFEGRDIRCKGASVDEYNTGVIGVVLLEDLTVTGEVGDWTDKWRSGVEVWKLNTQNVPPAIQIESLNSLVKVLRSVFGIEVLGGHREYPHQKGEDKFCPGNTGMELVEQLRGSTGLRRPSAS
ncbi:peptidoglycan recognition family protein [Pseudomonas sp. CCI3.2]|uniref:peptidoglycan recognition protein family protein n=1 Tax=unclassified Pseudomonas TaxID=196821 RepID=UPI002AC96488|nr:MULTISPECIES: peptidoglycan recognition family protein [unclassified Pseudomonas]MEB0079930.1 peptidoglycan recognition family protein [Pseudomonas sp. MH10out]MEB0093360.1 peptidoglycan recognition family protein [Pseudomonas sp. CCI4.2]MEB0104143.1 peptidoglycan recognition family protein [Pseudomonas sp. CCI3.2]MEB0130525.1 peptidoglycan recognition family protein [Pseudomonas sp. CCI2.4]MEB0156837.1 peptidoglycan recognition family protein [Pseudomonas sp. AH2 (2023)]